MKKVADALAPEARVARRLVAARLRPRRERARRHARACARPASRSRPRPARQRMRDVVNKNVTEEQLMQTAERVFSRGWTAMKLYFMIGLPTEEEEDVREIVARRRARARDRQARQEGARRARRRRR